MRQLKLDAVTAGLLESRGVKDRREPRAFKKLGGDTVGEKAAAHANDTMCLANTRWSAGNFRFGGLFIPAPKIAYVKSGKNALAECFLDNVKYLVMGAAAVAIAFGRDVGPCAVLHGKL